MVQVAICPLSGTRPNPDCPHSIEELFLEGREPTQQCTMHQAYWVNAQDGLLTRATSPDAVRRVFIQFPPLYQAWAREHDYPLPPERFSPHRPEEQKGIRIVHPNDGDVYAMDPVLRREYQRLRFTAVVDSNIQEIVWFVDDECWDTVSAPYQTAWNLSPGTHRIYAQARVQGELLRSPEITVHVVD